jgi:hypothetical protein
MGQFDIKSVTEILDNKFILTGTKDGNFKKLTFTGPMGNVYISYDIYMTSYSYLNEDETGFKVSVTVIHEDGTLLSREDYTTKEETAEFRKWWFTKENEAMALQHKTDDMKRKQFMELRK